jgi:hypothetical protein
MLPFLKNAQEASNGSTSEPVIRKPDESEESDEDEFDPLDTAAEEMMHASTPKEFARAFRAALELCGGPANG